MGLFKLAIIGGAAYYAGKKLNEPQDPNQNQYGGWGHGCHRRRQQQQQMQQGQQQYPGTTRDAQYHDDVYVVPEKNTAQYEREREREFTPPIYGYYNNNNSGLTEPKTENPKAHNEKTGVVSVQVRAESPQRVGRDPALPVYPGPGHGQGERQEYGFGQGNGNGQGWGNGNGFGSAFGHPGRISPQQRMYPSQPQQQQLTLVGEGQDQNLNQGLGQGQGQQMEFTEPKRPWSVDRLMWKQ